MNMRQQGFTLIELMVGMVIALLCMGMMMMMFKQVSQVSLSSSADAQYDTEIQLGLMVAQKHLQSAGFGSGQASDIAVGSFAGNDAIFWRFTPNLEAPTQYHCQGIGEEISQENNRYVHSLVLLTKTSCSGVGLVSDGPWIKEQTIVRIKKSDANKIYNYDLSTGNCTPYGTDENTVAKQQLTIKAARQYITGVAESIQHTLCLNNIPAI